MLRVGSIGGIGRIGLRSGLRGTPYTPVGPTEWFLRLGVFNLSGVWVDAQTFPAIFFLASGNFSLSGIWSDSEAYP